ncbi:excalibur calcium-binding domain-containing protein [Metabacillus malikii]|uniref:excalibur calcium-binding domain-containing protein n=1 Tax=Metabacillus malikii TaxID=1504265 RepID=UPI00351FBFBD
MLSFLFEQQEEIIEPEPETELEPIEEPEEIVYYKTVLKFRDASATPIRKGEPSYSSKLNHDGNGIACNQ